MPVVYGGDRPKFQTNPGAVQHYLVSGAVGASKLSIWTSEWQPDGGPTTKHTHPHEEVFLFLAGDGEGEVGDEKVTVRPGVAVIIPPNTVHWFRNTGSAPMRQVVVLASPDYDGPTGPATEVADPRPLVCLDP
ncbi:MAG: hypothetical protein CL878_02120 [Dehalococcoidia bacterium]|nr:hypothetical protein [Dehalococcoidia bacterium]